MADEDREHDMQPSVGGSSSDNPAADTTPSGVGSGETGPHEHTDSPEPTGTVPTPSSTSANKPAPGHLSAKTAQPPVIDPTFRIAAEIATVQAAFNMVNSPAVRMAHEMVEATRNMTRFAVPRFQPPILTVLNDAGFLKALNSFTSSLNIPQVSLAASLYESQQWRHLIDSLPAAQNLLVAQQIAPLHDAMQQHTKFLAGIIESTTNFQAVLNSFSRALQINWPQLFPNLKQLRKAVRASLLAAFLYADLWPAPSMPVELLDKIGQLEPGDDRRSVTQAVRGYYARQNHTALEQAIASWMDDPEYAARRKIFEAALTGHRQKLYELTIPTLLAQVEGIAGDFVHGSVSTGATPKLGKSGQIVKHAIEAAGNAGIADPDDAELLHVVLVEAVVLHVQHVSFENTDFAAQYADIRKRRTLNRHGTLHGIQINYPSAMNSLRCFLLLDALFALRKHARQIAAQTAVAASP